MRIPTKLGKFSSPTNSLQTTSVFQCSVDSEVCFQLVLFFMTALKGHPKVLRTSASFKGNPIKEYIGILMYQ